MRSIISVLVLVTIVVQCLGQSTPAGPPDGSREPQPWEGDWSPPPPWNGTGSPPSRPPWAGNGQHPHGSGPSGPPPSGPPPSGSPPTDS